MQFFEKLNNKPKGEQLFVIVALFAMTLGVFCLCGCGSGCLCSAECPQFGTQQAGNVDIFVCSLPGCGGCLTPGRGCDSSCWSQSCRMVCASTEEENTNAIVSDSSIGSVAACDVRYYGGDGCCSSCNQKEKSCYFGFINVQSKHGDYNGFLYGSGQGSPYPPENLLGQNYDERLYDCGGCGCGTDTYGDGRILLNNLEEAAGVN